MGLLDDAIREHLDLKRRRGADPDEVERAEREALGPVRRGPEESPEADYGPDPDAESGFAYDHEEEQDWDGEAPEHEPEETKKRPRKFFSRKSRSTPEPDASEQSLDAPEPSDLQEPAPYVEPPTGEQATQSHPASAPPKPSATREPRRIEPEAPEARPAAAPPARSSAPPPSGPAEGETVEYDVESALHGERTDEGEDVLEETPEFLQDTPEHDRLWFEQRPPRDFDFEG
jgi:hypothetical protein